LNRSNDIGETFNVFWSIFYTIGEKKGNLFRLDALSSDEIPFHALDGVGEALLEDVLVVLDNLKRYDG
jgi:hypothetical protein